MKKFWEVKAAKNKVGEVYIYGEVVSYKYSDADTTAKSFKDDLDALGDIDTLIIYVNSPGGDVKQGQAIHTQIKRRKEKTIAQIDGLAASIAGYITTACDEVNISSNGLYMIHKPMTYAYGNEDDLARTVEMLKKHTEMMMDGYLEKTGDKMSREQLASFMETDSWFDAQQCIEYGLCDAIGEESAIAACVSEELFAKYKNTPDKLLQAQTSTGSIDEKAIRDQLIAESQANLQTINHFMEVI